MMTERFQRMSTQQRAPFYTYRRSDGAWILWMRAQGAMAPRAIGDFDTLGEAIDHARRNWPWWL